MIIGQLNIRSFNNKKAEILNIIEEFKIDIFLIQETWLKDNNFNSIKNFHMVNKNRNTGFGGVAILLKNKIKYKIINSINIDPIEYIGVEISIKNKTFVIFSVYIPPEVPSNIIKEKLDLLQPIITNFKNVIFCGDMNIRHALWDNNCRTNSKKSKIFLNFLNDSNLITLNSGEHTHISHNSLTAIDISALSPNLIDYFDWAVHDETGGGDHRLITIVNSELEIENDSFKIIKKIQSN